MEKCKYSETPMDPKANLSQPKKMNIDAVWEYQLMVSSIICGMLETQIWDLGYLY
jgi:hypothetical protein